MPSRLYADGVNLSGSFQGNKVYGTCVNFIVIGDIVLADFSDLSQAKKWHEH